MSELARKLAFALGLVVCTCTESHDDHLALVIRAYNELGIIEKLPGVRYCSVCDACTFDTWVPHQPLFKCAEGGKMDIWTAATVKCPREGA